jgi:hypothetical protein
MLRLCVVLLTVIAAYSPPAFAIGSNLTAAGWFTPAPSSVTGSRERVRLTHVSGLLIGRPKLDVIPMITVDAAGRGESHLLLRSTVTGNGSMSLLVTMPPSLMEKTRNATFFIKPGSKRPLLAQQQDGRWQYYRPHPITSPDVPATDVTEKDLLAFRVPGPGLYWLLEDDPGQGSLFSINAPHPSPTGLMGSGAYPALLPFIWSGLLLALGVTASCWLHRRQRAQGA